jgi:phosphoserine phosphatase RsbU/P
MSDSASISAEQMKLVLDVSRLLTVTADQDLLLQRIAEAATSLINSERASIFLHDARTHELWTKVALGAREIRVPATAGIVGHVFQSNQILEVPRPYEDTRFNRDVDKKTGFVTRNLLTTPMRNLDGLPLGVLQIVNHVGGPFSPADHAMIELLADQAGVAIQRYRFQQEVMRTAGLRHEMDLAQRVQMALIPKRAPEVMNLEAVGWTKPASITGGDCYDLWIMTDGRLGIFLGDASGHGMGSALVVSQARTLVRALAEIDCDPTMLLARVNRRLEADMAMGQFVTAFLGCMDSQGVLHWSSAAQGPMLYRRRHGEKFELLEPVAPPLGLLPEFLAEQTEPIAFEPGGMLAVISDGVFEARSSSNEIYEVERLVDLFNGCDSASPAQLLALLRQAMIQWQGKEESVDDQTVVIVGRK